MYLDSAILVKLFVPEPDSSFYGKLVDGRVILSSSIAYTEVWSAMLTKERQGILHEEEISRAWRAFEKNIEEEMISLIPITTPILKKANRILREVHIHVPLRSLDAIHLATCDLIQEWPLCTNDKRMRQAAQHLHFTITETA